MIAFTELMLFGIIVGIIAMGIWSVGYFVAYVKDDESKTIIKSN
jgi:hypothetical protein